MAEKSESSGGVAVVTGAGSGIGRATTLKLLENGYRVALLGRRENALAETVGMAKAASDAALVLPTDVSDAEAVERAFNTVVGKFGRIDLLFNNAGMFGAGKLGEISPEEWRTVVDVNLNGSFYCAQAAFRRMREQDPKGGRIINNGSISAHAPRPSSIGYTSTKHAITGLTKSIALDGRADGIACGQIDIGNATSAMTATMSTGMPQADGSIRPEPTMAVDNVADAVLFMARLPLDANVLFMTVMATNMPFVGRG